MQMFLVRYFKGVNGMKLVQVSWRILFLWEWVEG